MLLEVSNLRTGYGEIEVLRGVSLGAGEGEMVAVIGPNGAGKSTLFRTIFGLMKAWEGSVSLQGEEITNLRPLDILKRGISYILQEESIFPKMTVQENMEMGAYTRKDGKVKEDIGRLYDMFPVLRERKDKVAEKLSGGERKMLVVSRALLLKPKILLLDEPTAGLSPKLTDFVFREIVQKVNKQGTTIIMVEQNAKSALNFCHRAYVLAEGQVKFEGSGEEILENQTVRRLYLGG